MGLLDSKVSKPTLFERVTLRGMFVTFVFGAVVSFLLEVIWILVGFAFFSAKESEVPWYYPGAMFITFILLLSLGGLAVTGLAAIIQYARRDE